MKKIVLGLLFAISQLTGFSQQIEGIVTEENGQAIMGASVLLKGTNTGAISNEEGKFSLQIDKQHHTLIVSAVGFKTDTLSIIDFTKPITIQLIEGVNLSELVVTTSTPGTSYDRKSISNLQNITSGELCKAACCNLSESFETNPSVDVAYSDAATGAKQIKLLGLAGSYVQMLNENVPTLRGIASPYGLGYTPGPWMESILLSKGAASVINGYESVTGQINVEYLKPSNSDRLGINIFGSDAGRLEGNLNAAIPINKHLSTGILAHVEDELMELDMNGDGFMDQPKVKQQNILNKWQYLHDKYMLNVLLRFLNEDRTSGQLKGIVNPYTIDINSKRYEFYAKNGYLFKDRHESSLGLIISGSLHQNESLFGTKTYTGEQKNWYANLIFQTALSKKHKLSTGGGLNYDSYAETLNTNPFNNNESTPGIFAEYTFNQLDKFIILAGARADYSSLYGLFFTPRLHLKYALAKSFNLRASAGKGYRTPNVLAENSFLLASSRTINIANDLKQEEAWNYGITATAHIPIYKRELTLQGEYFYTNFINQTVSDLDSNPHEANLINIHKGSFANSIQLEASMEILKGWTLTAAHRITDSKQTIKGELREKPLTNRYKSLITTSYQTPLKKWQFDFTAQLNGGGRMPNPDVNNPLWNKEFKPYSVFNAQITKYFRTWSIYIGSENIGNYTQNNPIIDVANPSGSNFDATMIWGPVHGRKIYAGLRWALPKK
jgi:outer membrane receptor for ferrienterochelin and colicin